MLTVFSAERQQQWRIDFKRLYLCLNHYVVILHGYSNNGTCVPLYPEHVQGQLSMDFELKWLLVYSISFLTKIVSMNPKRPVTSILYDGQCRA